MHLPISGIRVDEADRRLRLSAPALPDRVGVLRLAVSALATAHGATADARSDIELAVSEALANVVLHAYVGRRLGPMHVDARVDGGGTLVVEVSDEGDGLRPRVDSPGGGLGLALIATLAREVEISRARHRGGGARLCMRFDLAAVH